MKKIFCSILFFVLIVPLVLVGCTDVHKEIENYLTYYEKDLYVGGIDGYLVEWVVGTDSGADFAKISVTPTAVGGLDKSITVNFDGSTITLPKSATRYAYETKLSTATLPQSVSISVDGVALDLTLTSIKGETVDGITALKNATTEFFDLLNEDYEKGFSYTASIKLLPDRLGEQPYYYYVSFSNGERTLSALVEPLKGQVVAKRG